MRIGELLVMQGLITQEQLDQALAIQSHIPKKIGGILIENEMITEQQLVEALEFQLGVPVVNMKETVFDPEAVRLIHESMARKHHIVPVDRKGGKIRLAMIDPLNREAIKEVQMATGMIVQPLLTTSKELEQAIQEHYSEAGSVKELREIIESAVQQKATDIHFVPQETGCLLKYRINQTLHLQQTLPHAMLELLIRQIQYAAKLPSADGPLPQEGHMRMPAGDNKFDIRLSILPTVHGPSITLRLSDSSEGTIPWKELGFTESNLQKLEDAIGLSKGLILFSGPHFSGKTTALYSTLAHLNKEEIKIITLEDPIERRMDGIVQVEVNEQAGLTFPYGLRSILRQEPNVVMVSDIREAQTAELAGRAVLGGSLVLGAIHSTDAAGAISRLVDMGIDRYVLASSLTCIVSQRLVKRICSHCAQSAVVTDEEMKWFQTHDLLHAENQKEKGFIGNFRSFVSAQISGKMTVLRGSGCRMCSETGFHGYTAVQEVIAVDETVRELIAQNRLAELKPHLEQNQFKTMQYDGLLKAREGLTTVEEVLKALA